MDKKVTVIRPNTSLMDKVNINPLRVCAYVRVSTGSKEQADSYAAQIDYYTGLIEKNPLWEFVGVYADEATTGTKIKGREEFKSMIEECLDGNIDLIITKSVARFARNTVESIQTIRKLKEIGIGILFEKENINTLTEKSEMMITILSSIAQGESEDFSSNNRWAILKRFKDGTYVISDPAFGYKNDENGNLILIPEEAKIVRMIFDEYLNGNGTYAISKKLNELQIPTVRTAKNWHENVIKGILQNPIYEGDLLLQKSYVDANIPFKRKINRGEVEQYLIKDDHEPIISREEAEQVRYIFKYRTDIVKADRVKCCNRYLFTSRIICGDCGGNMRRQKIYIGKPYEKVIWTCPLHIRDKNKCKMKAIREDELMAAFIAMFNKLYTNQGVVLEPIAEGIKNLPVDLKYREETEKLDSEIRSLTEQCRILNQVMEKGYMDTALFIENQNQLTHQLTEMRRKKIRLVTKSKHRKELVKTEEIIKLINKRECLLDGFDEELFDVLVKNIEVSVGHDITFCLTNGLELTEENILSGGD